MAETGRGKPSYISGERAQESLAKIIDFGGQIAVAELLAEGYNEADIARKIGINPLYLRHFLNHLADPDLVTDALDVKADTRISIAENAMADAFDKVEVAKALGQHKMAAHRAAAESKKWKPDDKSKGADNSVIININWDQLQASQVAPDKQKTIDVSDARVVIKSPEAEMASDLPFLLDDKAKP